MIDLDEFEGQIRGAYDLSHVRADDVISLITELRHLRVIASGNQGAIVNSIIERTRTEAPARALRECVVCGEKVTESNATEEWEKRHEHAEPQGEPSDAQALVIHAERVGTERDDPLILELAEALRAALRAAGGVR